MYIQKKNVMMWKLEERREYAIDEYYCVLVHIYWNQRRRRRPQVKKRGGKQVIDLRVNVPSR